MILAMPTLIRELLNEVASIKQQTSTSPPNNSQSQIHNLVLEPSSCTIRHIQSRCPIHTIKTFLFLLLLQVSRAAVLQHHRDWVPSFSHHWWCLLRASQPSMRISWSNAITMSYFSSASALLTRPTTIHLCYCLWVLSFPESILTLSSILGNPECQL